MFCTVVLFSQYSRDLKTYLACRLMDELLPVCTVTQYGVRPCRIQPTIAYKLHTKLKKSEAPIRNASCCIFPEVVSSGYKLQISVYYR